MIRAKAELCWPHFIAYSLPAVAQNKEPYRTLAPNVKTTELLAQREQKRQNLQDGAPKSIDWGSSEGPAGALAKSLRGNTGGGG